MSLRARVLTLIGLILIAGVLLGSLLAGYEAKVALREELLAGMTGGQRTVNSALEDLPRSDHAARDLRQLIATFDGNRHVRAVLIDVTGAPVIRSARPKPVNPAPPWFARLFGPPPPEIRIAASAAPGGQIVLSPISDVDIGALWSESRVIVAALAASIAAALALVYLAIGAALRPLSDLAAGFVRIGGGDYQVRVDASGAAELRALERGFNDMVGRLTAMSQRNRALADQLLTLQDEERADLARDLHDEIGPHLFSVNVDAEMAVRLVGTGQDTQAAGHIRAIQASVGHMQRLVRDILGRLRPAQVTELGLNAAICDLVAFWAARAPTIRITYDLLDDETGLDEPLKDTVYRVIQESVNNAVRHAAAGHVEVRVARLGAAELLVCIDDDGAGTPPSAERGFGILGMRERVRDSAGSLIIDKAGARGGWSVTAKLPLKTAALAQSRADR